MNFSQSFQFQVAFKTVSTYESIDDHKNYRFNLLYKSYFSNKSFASTKVFISNYLDSESRYTTSDHLQSQQKTFYYSLLPFVHLRFYSWKFRSIWLLPSIHPVKAIKLVQHAIHWFPFKLQSKYCPYLSNIRFHSEDHLLEFALKVFQVVFLSWHSIV